MLQKLLRRSMSKLRLPDGATGAAASGHLVPTRPTVVSPSAAASFVSQGPPSPHRRIKLAYSPVDTVHGAPGAVQRPQSGGGAVYRTYGGAPSGSMAPAAGGIAIRSGSGGGGRGGGGGGMMLNNFVAQAGGGSRRPGSGRGGGGGAVGTCIVCSTGCMAQAHSEHVVPLPLTLRRLATVANCGG